MRLGDIMVIKGYLTVEQVKKITDTQKGLIVYCPQCDTQYNVVMFRPGASIQCYKCGSPLRIPARATSQSVDVFPSPVPFTASLLETDRTHDAALQLSVTPP